MRYSLYILAILCLTFSACEEEELINPIPEIEFISIGPSQVQEFQDSVVIRIFYKDGDGDLGGGHPDSSNVFIEDNRAGVINAFRLSSLVPNQEAVPIQGEIDLYLNSLFISDSSNSQVVDFSIYFLDRAGNPSNTIRTSPVTIYK